ncbi:MAG: HD domain-containing protein [Lachnospiraceae bacterium]|nr:HD domain-containing protein [Lachnospiraceae bacterium]
MLFIRQENLKVGMRLAKPIYNKKGVLLYERDSKLTSQGIESVKNFGIIGLYILEPAEPVPPMTEDDIEFERFQMVSSFIIQDELKVIKENHKQSQLQTLTASVIKGYGRLDRKINFVQNLRSKEDKLAKHSLNVAMLTAMITHKLNVKLSEQNDCVVAAIVHDIGKLDVPPQILEKKERSNEDERVILTCQRRGEQDIEATFLATPSIKRIVSQFNKLLEGARQGVGSDNPKIVTGAKVLLVANDYDRMTAMDDSGEPRSEVSALRVLLENHSIYDQDVVNALIQSVNFLAPGTCVELTNGEKGLVLAENPGNVLEPMILCFSDNKIIDLGQKLIYGDLKIKDMMKTLDNRCIMDHDSLSRMGVSL